VTGYSSLKFSITNADVTSGLLDDIIRVADVGNLTKFWVTSSFHTLLPGQVRPESGHNTQS